MPSSGIGRLGAAKLTLQKKKGKELVKAVGETFSPEAQLKMNSNIKKAVYPSKKNYK